VYEFEERLKKEGLIFKMADWETIFKEEGKVFHKPQEDMENVIKYMKKENVNKVLDLGCGSGRHVILLAKKGFNVYGTDISKEGIDLTQKNLKELGLKAELKISSCYEKFPFTDNFFDAVISTQVIHHNYIEKIRYCISEIERVLKKDGIFFVTVAARIMNKKRPVKLKKVKPRTYIPIDGEEEAGLPHYLYNKILMKKDFKNFKILNIHIDTKKKHYCLLGKLK
jgi:ubiquinone/menaquinone biosynthesis C-methylase UbiE